MLCFELNQPVHEMGGSSYWSIPEIVGTSEKHDTALGSVLVNAISQYFHSVKAKIEKTLWKKR